MADETGFHAGHAGVHVARLGLGRPIAHQVVVGEVCRHQHGDVSGAFWRRQIGAGAQVFVSQDAGDDQDAGVGQVLGCERKVESKSARALELIGHVGPTRHGGGDHARVDLFVLGGWLARCARVIKLVEPEALCIGEEFLAQLVAQGRMVVGRL